MSLALDAQTDIVTTQRAVSDIEIKKQQEEFAVLVSVDGSDILSVGVNNLGQNPVEILSIWIISKTLADQPATRYNVNYDDAFVPSGFTTNVLSTQSIVMAHDTYDIKVVSVFGSIKIVELVVGPGSTSTGLRAELITVPPDVIIDHTVTVAMIVTNTGEGVIRNIEPDSLSVSGTGSVVTTSLHTPSSVDLDRGESVMFSWDVEVTGDSGDNIIFSSIARGDFVDPDDVYSNVISDESILREPTDGGSGNGEEADILRDDLFGKPQLLMMFPNPVGWDSNDRGVWGVNVVNPTDIPIEVSKVVIVAVSPRATSSDKIFSPECHKPGNAPRDPITIFPTPDNWSCPESNQLQWKNTANPQIIQPRSVFPFLVSIGTEAIGSVSGEANNIPIHTTVFSTLGQFGKSGYLSTMAEEEVSIANVFLSTSPGTANLSNIISEIRGITEGTSVTFNATIADMDDDISNKIHQDARLVINIPKDWTFTGVTSHTGFETPIIQTFPDSSAQIIGKLLADLSGDSGIAKTIQFTATAPNVSFTKMYVMHILADGEADGILGNDYNIGPLAETVLQVCPTSGCP